MAERKGETPTSNNHRKSLVFNGPCTGMDDYLYHHFVPVSEAMKLISFCPAIIMQYLIKSRVDEGLIPRHLKLKDIKNLRILAVNRYL